MPIIENFRYRPDIDGLRAVAVLAVVLFHAGISCPGGFVGVDIFFVISGFLITSLIWKDLERGRFSFGDFWERRARRIVPALVVVTLVTLIAGWFLLLPLDFQKLGRAIVAQTAVGANIYYWRNTGYFSGAADEQPLLHTWSLAVEEQFYLIVPLLLWGMYRSRTLRSRPVVISVLFGVWILSFALSIYGMGRFPTAVFFLLPTRAWELLTGSLLSFLPSLPTMERRKLHEPLATIGLLLILIPIFTYSSKTQFPGLTALPPCLGAALLIWANSGSPTRVSFFLSARPVVFIGLISYSLYLWHWPFLAFSKYLALQPSLSLVHRISLVGMGFLCAILSWKYVETPFRIKKLGASRQSMFATAGMGLALVLIGGTLCNFKQGFPQRIPAQALQFANSSNDSFLGNLTSNDLQLTADDIKEGKLVRLGVTNKKLPPKVLVWGDSHAMAVLPAIDAFLKEKGWCGMAATHSGTAPVLDWYYPGPFGLDKDSIEYNDAVFSYIRASKIPNVILIAHWERYLRKDLVPDIDNSHPLNLALIVATVKHLTRIGTQPWVMLDVPTPRFDVPRALSRSFISGADVTSLCSPRSQESELESADRNALKNIKAAGGKVLDPKPYFLSPTKQFYLIEANGNALYRDSDHVSIPGAMRTVLPLLRDSFFAKKQNSP